MHVLLASVSSATSPAGVCRHAANIARGMLALPAVKKVTMLTGEWQSDYFCNAFDLKDERLEIRHVSISNRSLARNLWYLRGLPAAARQYGADIIHLAYPMPVLQSAGGPPVVVSLHDLYPFDIPQNFGKKAWLNRAALKFCLQNADAIACVSEETSARVHELFPVRSSGKTVTIPNSIYLPSELRYASLPGAVRDCPFFLCVAQHRANKNLPLLLRSFYLALDRGVIPADSKLVVVGKEGPETQRLHRIITQYHLDSRVLFLRGISDARLASLYANCDLVIAPSLLEGFGLPVAEALTAGSNVVCSDIPAFRSIGATRCTFFDPEDNSGESLLTALQKAITTPRSTAISPVGLEPQQAAAMYLALYSSLLLGKRTNVLQPLSAAHQTSGLLSASIQTSASERHSL
ncbi:glycosyltransferase family 4 protein [Acidicapsa ligni]|uniref:glycosyltransferase family 4 protein n=1 Tax=Acidicapsa ligni TaxID=542300 RepID=UPI0021DF4702|nr:glycosyltransferase family 1 protein [Acidicapsa ligni]